MNQQQRNPLFLACEIVINEARPYIPEGFALKVVEAGLHVHASTLKERLKELVVEADGGYDPIILGYGLCANAVVGLCAEKSTLVVPKVDDCICMMLGSSDRYLGILTENPGTYFLSRGWVEGGITLLNEYDQMVERYGEERAKMIQKAMLQHYNRLLYVDTGLQPSPEHEDEALRVAEALNLNFEKTRGSTELLEALVNGPWDDRFIVTPPGGEISFLDFGK